MDNEMYACGMRVSIPSLGVKAIDQKQSSGADRKASTSRISSRKRSERKETSRSIPSSDRANISDMLKMQLRFSDDIIESYCPEKVTYNKARDKLRKAWNIAATSRGGKKMPRNKQNRKTLPTKTWPGGGQRDGSLANINRRLKASSCNIGGGGIDQPVYLPVLQTVFPKPLSQWTDMSPVKTPPISNKKKVDRIKLGSRRWTSLPVRASTPPELRLRVKSLEALEDVGTGVSSMVDDDSDDSGDEDSVIGTTIRQTASFRNSHLLLVFHKLMSNWKIFVQPQHLTLQYCQRCLSNPSGGKQLYGLYIARKLFFSSINPPGIIKRSQENMIDEETLRQIENLLEAETERVRVAAAILLHCLTPNEEDHGPVKNKINHALLSSITSSSHSERWSSIQTLAITGTCNMAVIRALFNYYCNSKTEIDKEKSSRLLVELSADSKLVVSLLAETLNSKCWNERQSACILFPRLQHPLNKDVTDRILNSALRDWNPQVRLAAAQALGETNNGKMVHDAIKKDLADSDEITKLNALKRIHLLRLMTASLLPLFIKCFKDDHNSIKLEALSIAEDLELMDDTVIAALTLLLQDDSWKVKAHAIKAIGTLKIISKDVISHLLWAARFEQLPEVRAQVCNTLAVLGVKDDNIVMALKAILNVEDNELVLSEARKCLEIMGEDATPFDHMLDIVCAEVKALSTKEGILEQIVTTEKSEFVNNVLLRPSVHSTQ